MSIKQIASKLISLYLCRFKNVQDFFIVRATDIKKSTDNLNRDFYDIDNISASWGTRVFLL